MKAKLVLIVLMQISGLAYSQNQQMLNDALGYAKSLAPSSNGQIVNPGAVNNNAWSNTSVPGQTPSGMGQFSTPSTSSSYGSPNILGGLSTLGVKAQTDCSTYVNTGDPIADQRCAAINFMSAHCLTPTGDQNKILAASAASQGSLANCKDTFGSGSAQFDYGNTIKRPDPIFGPIADATKNANKIPAKCEQKQVVTDPAQYKINTCVKSTSVDAKACNQTLKTTVSNYTEPAGVTAGGECPPPPVYPGLQTEPVAKYDQYNLCIAFYNGTPPQIFWTVPDNPGYFVQVQAWRCDWGWCDAPFTKQGYSCPSDATLVGDVCVRRSVTASWQDNCTVFEQSAGAMLGNPE